MQTFPAALRIANSVATREGPDDSLEAINTNQYSNGAIVLVQQSGILYRLNKASTVTEDLPDIVAPAAGPGRWFSMGSGASQFADVVVAHAIIPPQSSVDAAFALTGILNSDDIVVYNINDSTLEAGVTTGPVRVTGANAATMRFTNTTGASVAADSKTFRMAVLDG